MGSTVPGRLVPSPLLPVLLHSCVCPPQGPWHLSGGQWRCRQELLAGKSERMASLARKRTDWKAPWHCGSSGTGRSASMLSGPADAMVFLLMNGPPSAASQDRRKHTVCLWPSHAKGAGLSESGCFIPTCAAQVYSTVFGDMGTWVSFAIVCDACKGTWL